MEKTKAIKKTKTMKRSLAETGYASIYNAEILNSFNPELQLKDTESGIRNKLKDLLAELKGFKFVTTMVYSFAPFIRPQRLEQVLIRVIYLILE